ncbi:MAG: sortase, partial [Acidimicrobiales bacterium]
ILVVAVVAGQAVVVARQPRRSELQVAPAAPSAAPAAGDLTTRLAGLLRRNRWAKRGISLASIVATIVAVILIGWPFYTNFVQDRLQDRLGRELASDELRQKYLDGAIQEGDSLTRLKIPDIHVDVVVVEGTTAKSLRAGAGHYAGTPMPCEEGNVAIAGHRTTYGRPLNHTDLLEPGDLIILEIPIGTCTYRVNKPPFVVSPTNVSVIENTPGVSQLTLTTCHPKGSIRQRLIIQADLVSKALDAA